MQNVTKFLHRFVTVVVCVALFVQLASCGTMLYPERRGQSTNMAQIDVKVVILDGILLFLFVVPGVIAYAVDFSTGCIYLPPGRIAENPDNIHLDDLQVIRIDPEKLDMESIARIVEEHTGHSIPLNSPEMLVFNPETPQIDIPRELARLSAGREPLVKGNWYAGSQLRWVTDTDGRLSRIEVANPTQTCSISP